LIKKVVVTNKMQLIMVNARAFLGVIIPFGISLIAVLGFIASHLWSRKRLKAIAALLANTIHSITKANFTIIIFQSMNNGNIRVCQPGTIEVNSANPKKIRSGRKA
jgi:cytochrome c biogenesis factor